MHYSESSQSAQQLWTAAMQAGRRGACSMPVTSTFCLKWRFCCCRQLALPGASCIGRRRFQHPYRRLHGLAWVLTRPPGHQQHRVAVDQPYAHTSHLCIYTQRSPLRGQPGRKCAAISLPFDVAQTARVLSRYAMQLTCCSGTCQGFAVLPTDT